MFMIDRSDVECSDCTALTRLARSMLSLKGKKASELTATAFRELIQLFFSSGDSSSGTSSNMAFQTAMSGPWLKKKKKEIKLLVFGVAKRDTMVFILLLIK